GTLQTSTIEPPEARNLPVLQVLDAPWADASTVASLADPTFAVIQGTRLGAITDTARPIEDAPPGLDQSLRYEWLDSEFAPGARGMGLQMERGAVGLYLSRDAARS